MSVGQFRFYFDRLNSGRDAGALFPPAIRTAFSDRIKNLQLPPHKQEKRDCAPTKTRACWAIDRETPGGRGEVRINTGFEPRIGAVPADIASRGVGTARTLGIFSH